MSKYHLLWQYIAGREEDEFTLTFEQMEEIAGIPMDHSFLKYKKELRDFGWKTGKISMKNRTVTFERIK
ncbi:MAG: hypothetical protein ACI4PP_02035 [Clostridia bacterium]